MYGDLQGIAGKTLQEIEGLELPVLEVEKSTQELLKIGDGDGEKDRGSD
jgi:ParB-like chromosome segregation protein Spo0J